jgi:outer membrane lipoprotein-sorting protein
VIGRNDVETHNLDQPLENVRPQHIYDALILREIDPQNEIAVMENNFEVVTDAKHHQVQQADYEIDVIRRGQQGWALSRKIIFSRTDLLPHRQLVYDQTGNLATDAHYEEYKNYNGMNFPSQIEIWRPQEEYDITITIVKLQLNEPLPDDKFALVQPPGAQVVHLDQPQSSQVSQDEK